MEGSIPSHSLDALDFHWAERETQEGRVDKGDRVRKVGRYTYVVTVKGDKNGGMRVEREVELVPQETS